MSNAQPQPKPAPTDNPTPTLPTPDQVADFPDCVKVEGELVDLTHQFDEVENNAKVYEERYQQMLDQKQHLVRERNQYQVELLQLTKEKSSRKQPRT